MFEPVILTAYSAVEASGAGALGAGPCPAPGAAFRSVLKRCPDRVNNTLDVRPLVRLYQRAICDAFPGALLECLDEKTLIRYFALVLLESTVKATPLNG